MAEMRTAQEEAFMLLSYQQASSKEQSATQGRRRQYGCAKDLRVVRPKCAVIMVSMVYGCGCAFGVGVICELLFP